MNKTNLTHDIQAKTKKRYQTAFRVVVPRIRGIFHGERIEYIVYDSYNTSKNNALCRCDEKKDAEMIVDALNA